MDWLIKRRIALVAGVLVLLYIAWAYTFMMESAVVGADGRRYFNLFDDAMISMRYAWNFAHGQGLVWNPGARVEGYTNLLLTLVMSIFTALLDKSTAVLGVQMLGLATVLACGYLLWKLCGYLAVDLEPAARALFRAAVMLLALTYYPLSFWTLTGMETGMLTLLILAALCMLERDHAPRRSRDLYLAAFLMGLAYLTRPDSVIFAVPLLAYGISLHEARGAQRLLLALAVGGIFLILPLGQELLRMLYYGAYLPNTYYLRLTGMPLADRLRNGLGFISLYLITHFFFIIWGALGCALAPTRRKWIYLLLVILPVLYEVWAGGDPLRLWRIMAPVQPLAAILFVQASIEILRRAGAPIPLRKGIRLFGVLTGAAVVSINVIYTPQILLQKPWFPEDFYVQRVNAAVALNEVTTPDASVGLLAAGVIPYYTGLRGFDFLGRTDPYIARLPADLSGALTVNGMYSVAGHNKYDLLYSIEQLRPTYIEGSAWGRQDVTPWVKMHYVQLEYKGAQLWLKRGAAEVRWDMWPQWIDT